MILWTDGRQFEMENGTVFGMRFRPQPAVVRSDNGAADAQAKAQSLGLGGKKRLKKTLYIGWQSDAIVPHRGEHG